MTAKHKYTLTALPAVGHRVTEGLQTFEVVAAKPHVTRDGRASGVIDWRSACRTCGVPITQQTGFLIRSFNKNCSKHALWAGKVEAAAERIASPAVARVHDQAEARAREYAEQGSVMVLEAVATTGGKLAGRYIAINDPDDIKQFSFWPGCSLPAGAEHLRGPLTTLFKRLVPAPVAHVAEGFALTDARLAGRTLHATFTETGAARGAEIIWTPGDPEWPQPGLNEALAALHAKLEAESLL